MTALTELKLYENPLISLPKSIKKFLKIIGEEFQNIIEKDEEAEQITKEEAEQITKGEAEQITKGEAEQITKEENKIVNYRGTNIIKREKDALTELEQYVGYIPIKSSFDWDTFGVKIKIIMLLGSVYTIKD